MIRSDPDQLEENCWQRKMLLLVSPAEGARGIVKDELISTYSIDSFVTDCRMKANVIFHRVTSSTSIDITTGRIRPYSSIDEHQLNQLNRDGWKDAPVSTLRLDLSSSDDVSVLTWLMERISFFLIVVGKPMQQHGDTWPMTNVSLSPVEEN